MQVWDTLETIDHLKQWKNKYNLKNNYSDMGSQWFVFMQVNLT